MAYTPPQLTDFLPTTRREMELRGWEQADVILFSGDAYVDHPSFGMAVCGRIIEDAGFRIAIVPQPDWHGDLRDFRRLGRPRLFFLVSPGAMDSMVNKYTAARRLRSEDAYTPDGRHDRRPDYPSIVYSKILKQLFPDTPVLLGGIEASLRRLTHYDYWQERVRPCLLCDAEADMIVYGMGEKPLPALCHLIEDTVLHGNDSRYCSVGEFRHAVTRRPVPQTVMLYDSDKVPGGRKSDDLTLYSHEETLRDKRKYAANFRIVEEQSNRWQAQRILQEVGKQCVVVNPPFPPLSTEEIDHSFDLPYTRLPHPKYRGHRIPAYDMIKHSVCLHRGCFGGCAFCTISAHQGKFIMSRSKESILREVRKIVEMPDFHGTLSDLGGPSANMYRMGGKDLSLCKKCRRPSCAHPKVCPNLNTDHAPLLDIYQAVRAMPGVKHAYIGSGVRYDLILHPTGSDVTDRTNRRYAEELVKHHVSGRLKVAPEHTADRVLDVMRKPSFQLFRRFKQLFDDICRRNRLPFQIIPYFISSHPGCTEEDMAELAAQTRELDFRLEQVQDFTPTPMTVATTIWYSGFHPYTLQPLFTAKAPAEKKRQRMFFFWYKPEERGRIMAELQRMGRDDLLKRLYPMKSKRRR
ncbi:MAG: YgiQ family radical SAM protein [Bacteroidaceae bacterium]|nr:YgiQ family radical SAM protein [Bacteroidaceae bacterium]